jgi:hypothetical protein
MRWLFGGFGVLVLMVGAATGSWYLTRYGPTMAPSSDVRTTEPPPPPIASGTKVAPGALPGCGVPLPDGGRCPGELECFGPMRIDGTRATATRVACTGRHSWETYAAGDLPAEVDAADHQAIWRDSTVQKVCNVNTFRTTTQLRSTGGWQFQILPPDGDDALAPGERTFRCLAGKGTNSLTEPTLAG